MKKSCVLLALNQFFQLIMGTQKSDFGYPIHHYLVPINLKYFFFTFVLVLPTRFSTQYDPMTLHTYSKGQPKGQQFCCHNSIQLYQRSLRVVYVVGYGLRSLLVEVLYVTLKRDLLHCVKRPSGYFADQTKCSLKISKSVILEVPLTHGQNQSF